MWNKIVFPLALVTLGSTSFWAARSHSEARMRASFQEPVQIESRPDFEALWEALIVGLEERCPPSAPVMVRMFAFPEPWWGRTSFNQRMGMYLIDIESRQPWQATVDTLIHEWAHALVWEASQDPVYWGHGPIWGVAYARVYREAVQILQEAQTAPGVTPEGPAEAPR